MKRSSFRHGITTETVSVDGNAEAVPSVVASAVWSERAIGEIIYDQVIVLGVRRRLNLTSNPATPVPSRSIEAGSGTGWLTLNV